MTNKTKELLSRVVWGTAETILLSFVVRGYAAWTARFHSYPLLHAGNFRDIVLFGVSGKV